MIKKSIVVIVVIVVAAAVLFAGTPDTSNQAKIFPEKAQNYIEEPGAVAGTPTLSNNVYAVPVILNGTDMGEIDIDAQTGENPGSVGGAP